MKTPDLIARLRSPGILLVAAAAVVIGLVIFGGWFWYSAVQARGLDAYAEALARAQASQAAGAPPETRAQAIRDLEAVLAAYPSNPAAVSAAEELGNLRYLNREYEAARGAFQVALAKGATGTLGILSRKGIAYAWESQREFAKAASAFQTALEGARPQDFLFEELMLGLARNQEMAGQKDSAMTTYRRLLQDLPRGRRNDIARTRLATLGVAPQP